MDERELAALARVQCELDVGRRWLDVTPETRAFYLARHAGLYPPGVVSVPPDYGVGAFAQWQQEIRAGVDHQDRDPQTWHVAPLYLAAAWEALGFQAHLDHATAIERSCLDRAVRLIERAVRAREAA